MLSFPDSVLAKLFYYFTFDNHLYEKHEIIYIQIASTMKIKVQVGRTNFLIVCNIFD